MFAGTNSGNAPAERYDYYIVEVKAYWRGIFQIATVIYNDYHNLNRQFRRAKPYNGTWSAWKEM
jgi:hypothetical protein